MRRRRVAYPALAALALLVAGCGNPAGPDAEARSAAVTVTPGPGHHAGGHGSHGSDGGHGGHGGGGGGDGSGTSELWAVQTGPMGVVVGDQSGFMLYRSDRDSADPPVSRCTADCAATWQPVTVDEGRMPELLGVQRADVGTIRREDGRIQLTLAGWPLYRHAGDRPGFVDTGAHGQDGVWFVVTPQGGKAEPR